MIPSAGEQILAWQQCSAAWPLLCSMDADHMPMVWDERGFLQCKDIGLGGEICGYIRYVTDIDPQILEFRHRPGHRGCADQLYALS